MKVSLVKAEVDLLRRILDPAIMDWSFLGTKAVSTAAGLLAKLDAPPPPKNADVGPIEQALVAASRGKVVEMDRSGYGRASVQAGRMGVTPEDAALVGRWVTTQGWLRGPLTLLGVLNKWPDWVAKARATQQPSAALPGFGAEASGTNAEATAGASRPGQGSPDGRPAPGFGRGR